MTYAQYAISCLENGRRSESTAQWLMNVMEALDALELARTYYEFETIKRELRELRNMDWGALCTPRPPLR